MLTLVNQKKYLLMDMSIVLETVVVVAVVVAKNFNDKVVVKVVVVVKWLLKRY